MPGCRGNYVPPGLQSQPAATHTSWNYWLLGPYQQNKLNSISGPTQGCQLM